MYDPLPLQEALHFLLSNSALLRNNDLFRGFCRLDRLESELDRLELELERLELEFDSSARFLTPALCASALQSVRLSGFKKDTPRTPWDTQDTGTFGHCLIGGE